MKKRRHTWLDEVHFSAIVIVVSTQQPQPHPPLAPPLLPHPPLFPPLLPHPPILPPLLLPHPPLLLSPPEKVLTWFLTNKTYFRVCHLANLSRILVWRYSIYPKFRTQAEWPLLKETFSLDIKPSSCNGYKRSIVPREINKTLSNMLNTSMIVEICPVPMETDSAFSDGFEEGQLAAAKKCREVVTKVLTSALVLSKQAISGMRDDCTIINYVSKQVERVAGVQIVQPSFSAIQKEIKLSYLENPLSTKPSRSISRLISRTIVNGVVYPSNRIIHITSITSQDLSSHDDYILAEEHVFNTVCAALAKDCACLDIEVGKES